MTRTAGGTYKKTSEVSQDGYDGDFVIFAFVGASIGDLVLSSAASVRGRKHVV